MEALTIYSGAVLATGIAAWAEHKQESQFLKIKDEVNNTKVTVFRGQYGTESEILVRELVVGDVITVEQGDIVPADCILIEEMNIVVDESKYGKPRNVAKEPSALHQGEDVDPNNPDNHRENPDICLLTGTMIMSGGGKAVVCAVGENTAIS
jgi:Ca2+-transporting ATPase